MSNSDGWQCLSVQEFLAYANWEGRRQVSSLLVDPGTLTAIPSGTLSEWGTMTVHDFFKAQNWLGQPRDEAVWTTAALTSFVPTVISSVQDFFRYLPWDGQPVVASVPKILSKSAPLPWTEPEDELTLTDLSDLF